MNFSRISTPYKILLTGLVIIFSCWFASRFYPIIGLSASMIIIIPILTAAYGFEFRVALVMWILSLLLNLLLLDRNSRVSFFADSGWILATIIVLMPGLVVARMRAATRHLQRDLDEHRDMDRQIQRRNAELEALQRASLQLTSSLDLKLILETILENCSKLVHADDVHVFLYDGNQLTFGAALWEDRRQHQPFQQPRQEGVTYTVARTGKEIIAPDVDTHPLYINSKWGGAIAAFPLSIGNRVQGVMNIAFRQVHLFTEDELRILRLLADQAAVAIQNAQLYETLRQQATDKERRVVERTVELLHSKEHAETMFNNSFDAIVLFNSQGDIQQVNRAFKTLFGFDDDALVQEPVLSLVHPDAKDEFLALQHALMATSEPAHAELKLQRPDGTDFVADIALAQVPGLDASHPNIVCSIRDISQRKLAEERQQTMTRGLRTVLAVANELISCPDVDTTFRHAVEAARNNLGLERCGIFLERDGYMQGTYGTDMDRNTTDERGFRPPAGDEWLKRVEHLRPDEAQWVVLDDNTQTQWDGGHRLAVGAGWIVVSVIPFTDGSRGFLFNDTCISHAQLDETQQEVVAVFCSLLGKIIERKQAEESIRRALNKETELGEMRTRFITTISHEFRTPMAIIQSSSQLLKYYYDRMNAEKKQEHLEKIEAQIQQMTGLLDNVLTISRAETAGLVCDIQPVDIIALCRSIMAQIAVTTGATGRIEFDYQGECSDCELDEKLVQQIVSNLLANAVKYSASDSPVRLSLICDLQHITIRVQDKGIGIPEDDQKHLFSDFHRGKNVGVISGTGLGLSIVKRAAAAHGGTVSFESTEGKGTTFTVTLPSHDLAKTPISTP